MKAPLKIILTGMMILLITIVYAQQFSRLYIGDQVPVESVEFNNVKNYPGGKAKLSNFKGKYVVLDFWTKGCSGCIQAFPHMERLQEEFKENLQILLITKNKEEELSTLFHLSPVIKRTKLPMIIGDSILANLSFPHTSVPYHVWLDREGKVVATTYSSETTAKNIRDMIAGKPLSLLERREIFDKEVIRKVKDKKTSLLQIVHPSLGGDLIYYSQIPLPVKGNALPKSRSNPFDLTESAYYSLFRKYLQGDVYGGYKSLDNQLLLDEKGNPKGLKVINTPLLDIYTQAFDISFNYSKIIVEGNAKQFVEEVTDTTNGKRYLFNNYYCYESSIPDFTMEKAKEYLRKDLVRAFGMVASIETRPMKCWVVKRTDETDKKLWAKNQKENKEDQAGQNFEIRGTGTGDGGVMLRNTTFAALLSSLSLANRSMKDPFIIDGTGFTHYEGYKKKIIDGVIRTKVPGTSENLPLLRSEFARYGLDIVEETRMLQVMVLTPSK